MADDIDYSKLGKKQMEFLATIQNDTVAVPPNEFARKQLEKMGWKEGEGLGKKSDGITKSIQVHRRDENEGHGEFKLEEKNDNWWFSCFDQTASKIQVSSSDSSSDSDSDSKPKSKSTSPIVMYTELFKACGGRRLGMRARASQNGKWKRINDADTLPSLPPKEEEEKNKKKKEKKHHHNHKEKSEKKHHHSHKEKKEKTSVIEKKSKKHEKKHHKKE
ncbi:hypothetical protein WA158_000804 [Blastocystis sp. Blastoise]